MESHEVLKVLTISIKRLLIFGELLYEHDEFVRLLVMLAFLLPRCHVTASNIHSH